MPRPSKRARLLVRSMTPARLSARLSRCTESCCGTWAGSERRRTTARGRVGALRARAETSRELVKLLAWAGLIADSAGAWAFARQVRATAARFIDIAEQHNIDQRRRAELVAAVLEPLALEDAGVGAVEVVVDEVLLEVELEGGGLGDQRAGEGGAPALFEDGELDALDAALLLGRPARIKRWRAPSAWTAWPKSLARNFGAVVGGDLLGCQPACASSRSTRCTSSRVWRERGLRSLACSSAQQNAVELPGFGGHVGLGVGGRSLVTSGPPRRLRVASRAT